MDSQTNKGKKFCHNELLIGKNDSEKESVNIIDSEKDKNNLNLE